MRPSIFSVINKNAEKPASAFSVLSTKGLPQSSSVDSDRVELLDRVKDKGYINQAYPITDPAELLALNQSVPDKLANSLLKGTVKLGTSFLNTTVGLLSSLGSGAANLLDNDPTTGFLSGFWKDPLSNGLSKLEDYADKALPNYQTQEYQDNNWYENLDDANFWGSALESTGFAAGTFLGTIATMGLGDAMLATKGAKALALAGEEAKNLSTLGKISTNVAKRGIGYAKAGEGLAYMGRGAAQIASLGKESTNLGRQLLGSGIAAISESKTEANSTYNESYDDLIAKGYSEKDADSIARTAGNVDFLGNMAILMASNYGQFKGAFAKGNTINQALRKGAKSYILDPSTGFKKVEQNAFRKALGYGFGYSKGALREGFEEWGQYKINKLAKTYAERSQDTQGKKDFAALTNSFLDVIQDTFQNQQGKTWLGGEAAEQFAIGALMGGLGLPNIKKNQETGKRSLEMTGGIFEARRDFQEKKKMGEEAGRILNEIYKRNTGKESQLKAFIAGTSFDRDIEDEYKKGNIGKAKALEAQKIAVDYITALDLGKEKDFLDLMQTEFTPAEIRDLLKQKNQDGTDIDNLDISDTDLIEQISKNQKDLKEYLPKIKRAWEIVKPLHNVIGEDATVDLASKLASVEEATGRMSKVMQEVSPALTDLLSNYEEEIPEIAKIKEFFGDKVNTANMPLALLKLSNPKESYNKLKELTEVLQKAIDKNIIAPHDAVKLKDAYEDLAGLSLYKNQVLDLYKSALQGPEAYSKEMSKIINSNKGSFDERINDSLVAKLSDYYDVTSLDTIEEPVYLYSKANEEAYTLQTIDGKPVLTTHSGKQIPLTPEFIASNPDLEALRDEAAFGRLSEFYLAREKAKQANEQPDRISGETFEGGVDVTDIIQTPVLLTAEQISSYNQSPKPPIWIGYGKTSGDQTAQNSESSKRWYAFINNTSLKDLIENHKLLVITPDNPLQGVDFYVGASQVQDNLTDSEALKGNRLTTIAVVVDNEGNPILDDSGLPVYTPLHENSWDGFSYPEFKDNETKQKQALALARSQYNAFQQTLLANNAKGTKTLLPITGRSKGVQGELKSLPANTATGLDINTIELVLYTEKTPGIIRVGESQIQATPGNVYTYNAIGDPLSTFKNTLSPTDALAAFELIKGVLSGSKETIKGKSYRDVLEELVNVGQNAKYPSYSLYFTKAGAVNIGGNFYNNVDSLEESKDTILQSLANKVYNINNKLLNSKTSYEAVTMQGDKLITKSYPSYKHYLLSEENRTKSEIPLLVKANLDGENINRYLTFNLNSPIAKGEKVIEKPYKGIKIVNTANIITQTGEIGAANYDRKTNTISLNRNFLKQKFTEKAWVNSRTQKDGSKSIPLPENIFNSYQEFENFVIEHEYQHSLLSFEEFKKLQGENKTIGNYEDEINKRALSVLNFIKETSVNNKESVKKQIAEYRAAEEEEVKKIIPNIDDYKVDGVINKDKVLEGIENNYNEIIEKEGLNILAPIVLDERGLSSQEIQEVRQKQVEQKQRDKRLEELKKLKQAELDAYNEIYDRYDKLITEATKGTSTEGSTEAKKAEIERRINNLPDNLLFITHITSKGNAINIYNDNLLMPAGVSSTTGIVNKEQLKQILFDLAEGKSPHRGYLDLFLGAIDRTTLENTNGKTLQDKLENYLDENFIEDVAKTQLPSSLNIGYFTDGVLNTKYDAELAALETKAEASQVSNPLLSEYKALKNKVNPRAKSRGNQVISQLSKQFDEKYPNFVDNLLETNTDFDRICS